MLKSAEKIRTVTLKSSYLVLIKKMNLLYSKILNLKIKRIEYQFCLY